MSEEFGRAYAELYDRFYHEKDYGGECDAMERIFAQYGRGPVQSIIDLGCGSGNHTLSLARAGYRVVGLDRSEAMLAEARRKLAEMESPCRAQFLYGDIRNSQLEQRFDAALMMFAVVGYQLRNEDVLAALKNARRHLHSGGLLIFDCWYGPAVLTERPSERVRTLETPDGPVRRFAKTSLDIRSHSCEVEFRIEPPGGTPFSERHQVRFFFPKELELYLELTGFELLRLGRFPEVDREPDETSWNVLCVAGAKPQGLH